MLDDTGFIGFKVKTLTAEETYYYIKNMHQDIIMIIDENLNEVANYEYDAYGNIVNINQVNQNQIAKLNPYRYRNYYYDTETNYYYLNARYYNPEIGRFITADDIEYLDIENVNGLNLNLYCLNNPINYVDPDGNFSILVASVIIGAIIGFGLSYGTDVVKNTKDGFQWSDITEPFNSKENLKKYFIGSLKGAVTGAAFGVGAGLGISAFKAGVRIAAKKAITAFIATTAGSVAAGMGIYALETKGLGLSEYNNSDLWKSGVKMGIKGGMNFGMGLLLGNQGFWNVKNSLIQRTYLKSTLMTPTDMIIEGLIDSIW